MKKLILDPCTKTVYSFDSTFHKQIYGVTMGLPLGAVLAKIITNQRESTVVKELVDNLLIKLSI